MRVSPIASRPKTSVSTGRTLDARAISTSCRSSSRAPSNRMVSCGSQKRALGASESLAAMRAGGPSLRSILSAATVVASTSAPSVNESSTL